MWAACLGSLASGQEPLPDEVVDEVATSWWVVDRVGWVGWVSVGRSGEVPDHLAVDDAAGGSDGVDVAVVASAEQRSAVEVGAATGDPAGEVVGVAPLR